jgi:hypothetical protein
VRSAIALSTGVPWQLMLLKPFAATPPTCFETVTYDADRHAKLLAEMQRLRGRLYVEDGALERSHLTRDGRHVLDCDETSWHLLVLRENHVAGCMRYKMHSNTVPFRRLTVSHSAPARCTHNGPRIRAAVEREIRSASQQGIAFGEAGGWALDERLRGSTAALRMVLAIYSLAQLLGDAIVLSTATMRNGSATILSRIGGSPLVVENTELQPYYDEQYKCEMSLLRFDSRSPNPRYNDGVAQHRTHLFHSMVLAGSPAVRVRSAAA